MNNNVIFSPVGNSVMLADGTVVPISKAFQVENILYLSGQIAMNQNGQITGHDIEKQTIQTIENIKNILSDSKCSLENVFKITVWLARLEDFEGFNRMYKKYFDPHYPVRSTVRSDLMIPEALVEIEVMAYISKQGTSVQTGTGA